MSRYQTCDEFFCRQSNTTFTIAFSANRSVLKLWLFGTEGVAVVLQSKIHVNYPIKSAAPAIQGSIVMLTIEVCVLRL